MSKRAPSPPVEHLYSSGSQESTTKRLRTMSTPASSLSTPSTRLASSHSAAGLSNVSMTPTILVDEAAAPSLLAQFGYNLPHGAPLPHNVIFAFTKTKAEHDSPPPPQYLRFDAEPESNTLYLPVSRTSNAPAASSQSAVSRTNAPAASSQSAPVDHDVFGGGAAEEKSYGGIGAKYDAYLHIRIDPNEQGAYQNRRYHLTKASNAMFTHFSGRTQPCCMICRTSAYLPDDHHQDDCPDGYANRTRDRDFEALGSPELVLPDDYAACFGCHVLMSKVGGWHQGPMGKKCPNAHLLVKFFYVALTRPGNLPNILTSELIPAEVEDSQKPHLAAFRVWAVKQLAEQRGTLNLHVLALWFMDHHKIIAMDESLYPLVVALKNQTICDNADYARGQRKYDL